MAVIEAILERARAEGIRPWIALKEALARRVVEVAARGGGTTLQGGAALHFAYGSPRLSADVDFVGEGIGRTLADLGDAFAAAGSELLGRPCRWSMKHSGRLHRGKLRVEIDPARSLVLPVEAFEVPAHRPRLDVAAGRVEEPQEIVADKVVASADRLALRGTLKTTDLYDLWFLRERLDAGPPEIDLARRKAADYGQEPRHGDLGAAARAVSPEELAAALDGILPTGELAAIDPRHVIEVAAATLEAARDVL